MMRFASADVMRILTDCTPARDARWVFHNTQRDAMVCIDDGNLRITVRLRTMPGSTGTPGSCALSTDELNVLLADSGGALSVRCGAPGATPEAPGVGYEPEGLPYTGEKLILTAPLLQIRPVLMTACRFMADPCSDAAGSEELRKNIWCEPEQGMVCFYGTNGHAISRTQLDCAHTGNLPGTVPMARAAAIRFLRFHKGNPADMPVHFVKLSPEWYRLASPFMHFDWKLEKVSPRLSEHGVFDPAFATDFVASTPVLVPDLKPVREALDRFQEDAPFTPVRLTLLRNTLKVHVFVEDEDGIPVWLTVATWPVEPTEGSRTPIYATVRAAYLRAAMASFGAVPSVQLLFFGAGARLMLVTPTACMSISPVEVDS